MNQPVTTCPHQPEAVAHALGQPGAAARAAFEAHADACAVCREEAATARRLAAALRQATPEREPSPGLTARIVAALPPAPPARAAMPAYFPPLAWALAASVIIAVGMLLSAPPSRHPASASPAAAWIAGQQQGDGTWLPSASGGRDAYRPALTALAAWALDEAEPGRHAARVDAAVKALLAMQQADGGFGTGDGARMYNHAIVTRFLLHAAGRAGSGHALARPIEQAVRFTCDTQNAQGGWDYGTAGSGNTGISAWQVAVLEAAAASGWRDEGGHLRRGLNWLGSRADAGGAFGYRAPGLAQGGGDTVTLTAMSAVVLLRARQRFPELESAAARSVRHVRPAAGTDSSDYYRDYFLAGAFDAAGETAAAAAVRQRIADARRPDGAAGAPWIANDAWGSVGGDLYATALALLSGGA